MKAALAVLAGCLAITAAALAFMALSRPGDGSLDERTRAVAATLKCPVCHDLSVADSPAPVAQEMRAQIRSELQAGETPDQIRQKFVDAYGPWILLTPPARGFDLWLWVAPALAGLAIFGLLVACIRRWSRPEDDSKQLAGAISRDDRAMLDRALSRIASE